MEVEPILIEFPSNENPDASKTHTLILMDSKHERIRSHLKVSICAKIERPISNQFMAHIDQRLHECFLTFTTPSHPPYSSMIQRAISDLKDEEGSTKEAISAFLKREYKNLPWGHESFLSHHLRKLCMNRDIKCANNGHYVLIVRDCNFVENTESSKKRRGRRGKQGKKQGRVKKKMEKQRKVRQEIVVFEGTKDSEKQLIEMADLITEAPEQPEKCEKKPRNCTSTDNRYSCIMAKLKDLVYESHIATNPSMTNMPEFKSHIEQQLQELFHNFYTPTHPPYAFMIQKAQELKQEGQLTEEEISAFIKREFKDLPFGHESFLHHHLMKIHKDLNPVHAIDGRYVLGDKREKIEMTKQQIRPWSQEPLHAMELKHHNERISTLERDAQELAFNKLKEGQVSFTNSLGRSQNLNCNYSASSLKDMCMESVMKTKEFEEKLLGFSISLKEMEKLSYDNCRDMSDAERKECLNKEKLMQTQTSFEEMKSNIVVIEGEKQLQLQGENMLRLCYHGAGGGVNLTVACKESSMPVVEEGKQSQITSPFERRELVCGVSAQRHHQPKISGEKMATKSYAVRLPTSPELCIDTGQHLHLSSMEVNKNITVSSQADSLHQYEQQPPKRRGRPRKKKWDETMIAKSELPSNGHDWNEQQQQLERQGNIRFLGLNAAADTTMALSLSSHDQNHNKQQQLQARKRGRCRRRT